MKTLFDHVERLLNYLFPSLEETSSKVTDIPWLRKCARYAPLITFLILGVIFLFLPIAAGGIFSVLFFLIAAFWYGLFGAAIKFLKKKKRDYSIVKLLFPVFSLKFLFVFTVFLMLHISLHTKIDDHEKFMQEMESRREKDPSTHELIQLNFQAMYKSPLEQQTHSKFQEAFPSGEANVYSAS